MIKRGRQGHAERSTTTLSPCPGSNETIDLFRPSPPHAQLKSGLPEGATLDLLQPTHNGAILIGDDRA
jgi:hypothetical protein